MPHFLYKAKKGPGEVLEGRIEAGSETAAVNKLMEDGYYPIWVKEESTFSKEKTDKLSFFSRRIKTKDIADFTRQLSELLDSGLQLYDSLNILENQISILSFKEVITDIKDRIKDGSTFSESLKAHPRIFSNLYVNLVKSGEAGSMLNDVLDNISDFLEKQEDAKSKIIAALSYPILMAGIGFLTIFVLIGFVIPRLTDMFIEMGQALPLTTRIIIGLGQFIRTYWILLVIFAAGLILFIKKGRSNKVTKKALDSFKLKLPIFGALIGKSELARFSRTLSTLLRNGVPILNSLKVTSDVIDNEIIKEEVESIYNDVKAGSSLRSAIKKNTSFPPFLINMIDVGEQGGILDKTLLKVAKSYEIETERMIKIISSLLEPAMILVMGLIVGFVVISMLLPVFQISLTAH